MPCQVKTTTQKVGEDFGRPVAKLTVKQGREKVNIGLMVRNSYKVIYCLIIVSFPLLFPVTQTL